MLIPSGLQRVLVNSGWLITEKGFRLVVGIVVTALVARHLGASEFGVLSYLIALVGFASPLATLGQDTVGVRAIASSDRPGQTVGSIIGLRLMGGLVAACAGPALVLALDGWDPHRLMLAAIISSAGIFLAADACEYYFLSRLASRSTAVARTLAFVVSAGLRLLLVLNHADLVWFAVAVLADAVVAAAALITTYGLSGAPRPAWDGRTAVRLLAEGAPLILSAFLISIYMRIDQVMLAALSTPAEVGHFSAAVRISEAWTFIPGAIAASSLPVMVELQARSPEALAGRMVGLYAGVAWLGVAVGLTFSASAWWLIPALYGPGFAESAPILAIISWSGVFMGLGMMRSQHLTALGLLRWHPLTVGAGALVNIGLNVVLIPRWGGLGAAVATIVSYWTAVHGACHIIPRLRPIAGQLWRAYAFPFSTLLYRNKQQP